MLTAKNVSVQYRRSKNRALEGVSFQILPGELVALTGDNGAGKSTLISVLNGSLRPSAGGVYIDETNISAKPQAARRATATMQQTNTPIRGLTPMQTVINSAMVRGAPYRQARRSAEQIFDALDMSTVADNPGESLSGGLRRLTNFCAAAVQNVELLLLDEPTNDVSPSRRALLWKYVSSLCEAGRSVLVSTDNLSEAADYTQRQIVMASGKIVYDGAVDKSLSTARGWTLIEVPLGTQLPVDLELSVINRGPDTVTLEVPDVPAQLSNILLQLQTKTERVTLRRVPSFEAIFQSVSGRQS